MAEAQALIQSSYQQTNNDEEVRIGYKHRQCGCFWILLLVTGLWGIVGMFGEVALIAVEWNEFDTGIDMSSMQSSYYDFGVSNNNIFMVVLLICWAMSTIWLQIEDRGQYMLVTYGPCRWMLCGMGKEKIFYHSIRDVQTSKSCFYGFGIPMCSSVKLFNTCSCCCGLTASEPRPNFCGHQTIKLTIVERAQGENALEDDDCFGERCCLQCCCGANGEYCGKGCCCQFCINPCDANFCMMNTVFISTNDTRGLMRLINEKMGGAGGDNFGSGDNHTLI
mmetsp:Transcript_44931/g.74443  ORF Transcript_44931/g.74443 Transcript_44931/m.74443 type:complete len:278 (+) Transcript_44931:36-869(+)